MSLVTDGLIFWSVEMQPHAPFTGSLTDPISQPPDPGASGGQVPIRWGWEGQLADFWSVVTVFSPVSFCSFSHGGSFA